MPRELAALKALDFTVIDDAFIEDMRREIKNARIKFPTANNPTIAALTEETGELAREALHMREGKHNDWWRIWDEAVQVAVMALRMASEGDYSIAIPTEENCEEHCE